MLKALKSVFIRPVLPLIVFGAIFLTASLMIADDSCQYQIRPIAPPSPVGEKFSSADECDYDMIGPLDAVGDGRIVVGDREVRVALSVNTYLFSPGDYVGVSLNKEGEAVQIVNLNQNKKH